MLKGYSARSFSSVATDTCGQLRPLKFKRTRCEYWSWDPALPCASMKSSIQNTASICAVCAFGLPPTPERNAIFDVPPPDVGGFRSVVEIVSRVMDLIVLLAIPAARTTLGLSTICCVTWGISPGEVRKFVAVPRLVSG